MGVLLATVVWIRGVGMSGALVVVVPFIALPLVSNLFIRQKLSTIADAQPRASEHIVTELSAHSQAEVSACQIDDVSRLSRPRDTRLTMRGYFYIGAMILLTAFLLWVLSLLLPEIIGVSSTNKTKSLFASLVWALGLWSCVSFFRNRIRERRLFMNGELSQGMVVSRSDTRAGRQIVYCYRDGRGHGFQNRTTDFSNRLYEEMPVHVFYNPLDSRQSAVLEASLYRVA
jgi:hypothetical protein